MKPSRYDSQLPSDEKFRLKLTESLAHKMPKRSRALIEGILNGAKATPKEKVMAYKTACIAVKNLYLNKNKSKKGLERLGKLVEEGLNEWSDYCFTSNDF